MVEAVHNRNSMHTNKQISGGFGENVIELENGILTPRISESDIFHDKNPSTIEELSKRLSEICSSDIADKTSLDSPLITNDKVIEFVNDILAPLISDTQPIHDKSLCNLGEHSKEPNGQYPNDISERVSLELPLISDEKVNELVNDILAPNIPESGTFRDKSLFTLGELSNLCSNNIPERTLLDLPCIFNDSEISNGPGKDIMAPQNCQSASICHPISAILDELNKSTSSPFQNTTVDQSLANVFGEKSTSSRLEDKLTARDSQSKSHRQRRRSTLDASNKEQTNIESNNVCNNKCPNIVSEKDKKETSNEERNPSNRILAIKMSESESIRQKSPLLLEQLNKGRNEQKTAGQSTTMDVSVVFGEKTTRTEIGNELLTTRISRSKSGRHEKRINLETPIKEDSKIELNDKSPNDTTGKTLVDPPFVSNEMDNSSGPKIEDTSTGLGILPSKTSDSDSICDKNLRSLSECKDNQQSHGEKSTPIDIPPILNEKQVSTTKNDVLKNQTSKPVLRRRKSPSNSKQTKKQQAKCEPNRVDSKNVADKSLSNLPTVIITKMETLSKLESEIVAPCDVQSQYKPSQSKRAHRKSPSSLDGSKKESSIRQNTVEPRALLDLPLVLDGKDTSTVLENEMQAPEPKSGENKSIMITKKPNVQVNNVNSSAFEETLLALPIIFEEKINSDEVGSEISIPEPEKVRRKSPNLAKSNKMPNVKKVELKPRQSKIKAQNTNSTPPKQRRSIEAKQASGENQANTAEVNGKGGRQKIRRKIDEIV